MSDIFREVDEDVRHERLMRLWKRYGLYVVGGVVLLLVLFGGWKAYESWRESERQDAANAYVAALAQVEGDAVAALASLETQAAPGKDGYGLLAALQAARLRASAGDLEGALAEWEAIRDSGDLPRFYRDMAGLLIVQHRFEQASAEQLDADLAPLLDPASPVRPAALELAALLALREGDHATARTRLSELTDDSATPLALRQRATQLLGTLPE
ncbi:MAG: tetratricopeptide repeat protein [Tistlia sp.]